MHWVEKQLAQARGALAVPQISVVCIGRMAMSRRVTRPRDTAVRGRRRLNSAPVLGSSVWRCLRVDGR